MRRSLAIILHSAAALACAAQGLEDVLLETYAVSPSPTKPDDVLTTYRIYADLAAGYSLQMAYGDDAHVLKLISTTDFFNDTVNGDKFADRVNGDELRHWPSALDTWLTIGAASDVHLGVPKHLDPDGSVLPCPPYPDIDALASRSASRPATTLCVADGLVNDTSRSEIVDFRCAPGYLHKIRGGTILTSDGAWARLGGCRGATPENMVLIAQITTTGKLSFALNLQLAAPDRSVEKYVHSAPREGERQHPALTFPRVDQ